MQRFVCTMSPSSDCDQVLSALNAYRREESEKSEQNSGLSVNFESVSHDGETQGSVFFKAKKSDGVAKLRIAKDSEQLFLVYVSEGE